MDESRANGHPGALVLNRDRLTAHGLAGLRADALDVACAGLAACDPGAAVRRTVSVADGELRAGDVRWRLPESGRVVALGAGKATLKIAVALAEVLGSRLDGGIVAVRRGEAFRTPPGVAVIEAGHPLPDDASFRAAQAMLDAARGLGECDLLIACFTGGSSALASLPPASVSAAEKRELHELLLAAGIPIAEVNAVRKQVSAFKGGRLALAAAPASVLNLTVSDVAGDRLDVLTDPSVQDGSTPEQALAILESTGLTERVAPSILDHLGGPEAGTPDVSAVEVETTLLVTGATACEAMAAAAMKRGYEPVVLGIDIEGEARQLGSSLAAAAIDRPGDGPAMFIGCGGEASVALGADGSFGAGGPNQEAALAAAATLAGHAAAAVFLDTDGSDGGTGLAGAAVDGATGERATELGLDLEEALASHRSGEAVAALGDGIVTGPTGTNVNDLFAIAVA